MSTLGQLAVDAVLGTWDPSPVSLQELAWSRRPPLGAGCCFIYLRAQVTFLEERRTKPVSKGLSAFTLLLLCHFTRSQGWKWIAGQPGPSSFSSSVDIPPRHLTLQRVISASSYFFHGFATQRPNRVRLTDLPSTTDSFFFIFENPYTVHLWTSHNLHSVL